MAYPLTIEIIKKHCNIDSNEDDDLLIQYRYAATQMVGNIINQDASFMCGTLDDLDVENNICISQAILMLIGHFYKNRDAVSGINQNSIPFGVEALLAPYIKYD